MEKKHNRPLYRTMLYVLVVSLLTILSQPTIALDFFSYLDDNEARQEAAITRVSNFRKQYKLIFLFSSRCSYCHRFAPVLRKFAIAHSLTVDAITADGGKVRGFENARYDKNALDKFEIDAFPTVLVAKKQNPYENYILSQGLMSFDDLNYNYKILVNEIDYD